MEKSPGTLSPTPPLTGPTDLKIASNTDPSCQRPLTPSTLHSLVPPECLDAESGAEHMGLFYFNSAVCYYIHFRVDFLSVPLVLVPSPVGRVTETSQ